eukprot:1158190-Pelagomonas_calceolata.AAC.9
MASPTVVAAEAELAAAPSAVVLAQGASSTLVVGGPERGLSIASPTAVAGVLLASPTAVAAAAVAELAAGTPVAEEGGVGATVLPLGLLPSSCAFGCAAAACTA